MSMLKFNYCILTLLTITTFMVSIADSTAGELDCKGKDDALNLLTGQIKKDRLYESRLAESCYSYRVSKCSSKTIEIELHEIHVNQCGGDPLTTPIIDRYRVNKKTKHIEWYYPSEGEYVPYKGTLINRLRSALGR